MKRPHDLTGKRFKRLVVRELSHVNRSGTWWLCDCDCGKKKLVRARCLVTGVTGSCGCYRVESSKARAFGGKRGMHTRMVLDTLFTKPKREIDRSEKTWSKAEDAVRMLAGLW